MAGARIDSAYSCTAIVLQRLLEVQTELCQGLDLRDATRGALQDLLRVSAQRVSRIVAELKKRGLVFEVQVWPPGFRKGVGVLQLTRAGLAQARMERRAAFVLTVIVDGEPDTLGRLHGKGRLPKTFAVILRHIDDGVFDRAGYEKHVRVERESIFARPKLKLNKDYIAILESALSTTVREPKSVDNAAVTRRT